MPGALSHHVLPCLEECSGKLCGLDFGVCYSPEFVALGTVIRDFLNPDLVLIGESDSQSGDLLERFFLRVCENRPPVMRMNFINAEIAKIALNSYITTKITFANMLAQLCEESDGANVDVVTSALGRDSRIGSKYFKGATGYGGPCFPRDNLALLAYARMKGLPATLASVTDSENRVQIERLATRALAYLPPSGTVGILGLAYKPDTNVVDESPGFLLAQYLLAQQIYVVAYDPVAMEQPAVSGLSGLVCASSMTECIRQADVVIIPTPWPEFREAGRIVSMQAKRVLAVIDCWRLLNPSDLTGVTYIPVGIG
jgi:UDPglucose 6-dehydrogenase